MSNIKTTITIHCNDKTKRVIQVIGIWNVGAATSLDKDIEGRNFKYATIAN